MGVNGSGTCSLLVCLVYETAEEWRERARTEKSNSKEKRDRKLRERERKGRSEVCGPFHVSHESEIKGVKNEA